MTLISFLYPHNTWWNLLPSDMKKGILKRPSVTLCLSAGRLSPSNGSEPHTNTYSTTPRL